MQIGEEKKLLVSYKDQLVEQSALVARARQALGTSGSVSARDDYSRQSRELKELRESLAVPVHKAQLDLVRLERQQQALRLSAGTHHDRSSTTAILSASR